MKRTMIFAMAAICCTLAVSCGSQKRCHKNAMTGTIEETGTAIAEDADDGMVGAWEAIRMTADTLDFDSNGGERTVVCLNYDRWWLNDIQIAGTEKHYGADPGRNNEYLTAKAPGISAEIIRPNTLRVKVDPSEKPANWIIHLESGNAFTSVKVNLK